MPTINRNRITCQPNAKKVSERRVNRQKYYQKTAWRKLRDWYIREHPLCERCSTEQRPIMATEVHHKKSPFSNGLSEQEREALLLDPENLEALCADCHKEEHNKIRKNKSI